MLTLGKVVDVLTTENKLRVRTPVFETSGDPTQVILTCAVCHDPGSINGYKVDDTVYVTFTDNEFNRPVVLGKLYLGLDKEENSNSLKADSIEVSNSAILPANTKIGQLSLLDLHNNIKKLTTIENILNNKQNKLVAGSNITLTVNPLDDTVTISSSGGGGGGDAVWGSITGTLSNQTDLNLALAGKASSTALTNETVTRAEEDGRLQTAINTKQDKLTAGTGIDITNNVITCTVTPEQPVWGNITGTLSNQTDLNTALSSKASTTALEDVANDLEEEITRATKAESDNLETAEAYTDSKVSDETAARQTADQGILDKIGDDGDEPTDDTVYGAIKGLSNRINAEENTRGADDAALSNRIDGKQNTLTPGTGISITNDTISSTVTGITDITTQTIVMKDLAPGFYRLTYNGNKIMDLSNTETYVYTIANTGIVTLEVWEVSSSGQIRKCAKTHQQDWTKILLFYMDTNATHGYVGGVLNDGSPIEYVNWTFVSNIWAPVVNGTSGQVLQANGDNNAPTWTATPTFTSARVTTMGTDDNSVVNKKYVDDLVGQINAILATLVTPE